MPVPRPTVPLAGSLDDPERARDLARMKRLATGLFLALPLKIAGGTGSPVRVVLLTD